MCSGAALLYGIPRIVVGENKTFQGPEEYVRSQGVAVEILNDAGASPLWRISSAIIRRCGTRTSACRRRFFVRSRLSRALSRAG